MFSTTSVKKSTCLSGSSILSQLFFQSNSRIAASLSHRIAVWMQALFAYHGARFFYSREVGEDCSHSS